MSAASQGQALELVSRFASETKWNSLDGAKLQTDVIDLPRDELARRFTDFLANGAKFIMQGPQVLTIDRKKTLHWPTTLGSELGVWRGPWHGDGLHGKELRDSRCTMTELDFNSVHFLMLPENGEPPEKLNGIDFGDLESRYILLDEYVCAALLAQKNHAVLEWIYRYMGIDCLTFLGATMRNSRYGEKSFVGAERWGGEWRSAYSMEYQYQQGRQGGHDPSKVAHPVLRIPKH
jgi:hypothetical protein